jgi:Fe-S-cluster containining protein
MESLQYFWLNVHLNYACRHSGMCCSSGWPIPVERAGVMAIDEVIARDRVPLGIQPWLVPEPAAPEEFAGTLAMRRNGHCVFFEANGPGCAIHEARPASCVHFPYVCLIDPRGVRVTLSHYCPTAAEMLFEHDGPVGIVAGPRPVPENLALEGLDARDALPPASPGASAGTPRLMSFEEFDAWEREAIAGARIGEMQDDDLALFAHARASVPPPWSWPAAPRDAESLWWNHAAPRWPLFQAPLSRYAAAKVFGSWAAYKAEGLDAILRVARVADAVLRVECARQVAIHRQPLDRELLKEAIRQSDLLLVHYADPDRLAAVAM